MSDTTYDVSQVRSYLQGLQTRIADALGALAAAVRVPIIASGGALWSLNG
mgnify:CR=1 FL=1